MTINKASVIEFPGLDRRKMIKSSPQILGRTELEECAKAVAIMVLRFSPNRLERYYNAHEIATHLGQLPHGQLSSFHVELDTLKKALSNELIRHALSAVLPGKLEFFRSSTRFDVISSGNSSFRHGYQVKFNESTEEPNDLRNEINDLRKSLVELYYERENRTKTIPLKPALEQKRELTVPVFASPPTTASLTPSDSISSNRKRGRPVLTNKEANKRAISLRNQIYYTNANRKKSVQSV